MGGGGGGDFPASDVKRLEQKAIESLKEANTDTSRHVFISFANEDKDEVNLLRGQARDKKTDLQFDDHSVKEAFDSKNADYIKRQIREKLERVSVTVVYLSANSEKSKWVEWEIQESLKMGKGVIGVYKGDRPPQTLPKAFDEHKLRTVKWSHDELSKAIEQASKKR